MVSDTESVNPLDAAVTGGVGGSGTHVGDPTGDQHPEPPPITEEEYLADAQRYMALVPDDKPAPTVADDAWKNMLIMRKVKNKETKEEFEVVEQKSQNNIYLMTRYSDLLRGMFIMNEFTCRKMVVRCPPWERQSRFKPRDIRDDDYSRIMIELERLAMLPTREKVISGVESICHDRSFHPVQKYFRSLIWDGTRRLNRWIGEYLNASTEPAPYLEGIGIKWMVAAVARIFKPGCKFDHMLVLEGNTDIGKSAVFRSLATFHGEEYFYDGMTFAKIGEKDTMQNIQGSLIIEFPELSSLHNREVEEVKQWITMQEDRGRKPYSREPVMLPRQFVLAGSTNNSQYLKDQTGNKRFWPVECGKRIKHAEMERDKEQLWAEAVHLFNGGYKWWIPEGDPLGKLCADVVRKRLTTHPWESEIMDYIDDKDVVTVQEILLKRIEKKLKEITRSDQMIVAGVLKNCGFENSSNGKQRSWRRIKPEMLDV